MNLFPDLEKRYTKDRSSAIAAQRLAHEIAFAPVVFQISRLMIKFGILQMLCDNHKGLTMMQIVEKTNLSKYAVQVLLEASLSIGTVIVEGEVYKISKAGWFLQNDKMVKANLNFNHDVNYLGLFDLEAALVDGRPAGLKVFGNWPTIYEGLSQLPKPVQDSWFGFDHFYSDNSFEEALQLVFSKKPKRLLDVGGNTGRWATQCVQFNSDVEVTIMDLPQQIEMMKKATAELPERNRIKGHGANLLDENTVFPTGFDAIWMSQFLDCFSEEQVTSILSRAAKSISDSTTIFVMETFWDRQKFETAAYDLTLTTPYFTAMANGNSKMFHSDDFCRLVEAAGLRVAEKHDGIGLGHSIFELKKK